MRRTTLVGWVLLIDETHNFMRLLVGLFITIAYFCAMLVVKPYKVSAPPLTNGQTHARDAFAHDPRVEAYFHDIASNF